MKQSEFDAFHAALQGISETLQNRELSGTVVGVYWKALEQHELSDVLSALDAHLRDTERGMFMPKPADLLGRLGHGKGDGRPGADEAWSMMPKEERDTGVVSAEMFEAWGAAGDLYESDPTAARMAFRSAYDRAVEQARAAAEPLRWTVSLGFDREGRDHVLIKAAQRGLIGVNRALELAHDKEKVELALPAPASTAMVRV